MSVANQRPRAGRSLIFLVSTFFLRVIRLTFLDTKDSAVEVAPSPGRHCELTIANQWQCSQSRSEKVGALAHELSGSVATK